MAKAEEQGKQKSIAEILQEVADDICTNYCKWPDLWDQEQMGMELWESDFCDKCPLNRIVQEMGE